MTTDREIKAALLYFDATGGDDITWKFGSTLAAALRAAEEREAEMRAALGNLLSSKILTQIRPLVAGWNGENRPEGPHEPHPNALKVTLTTNAGQVYALDKAIEAARALEPRT